MSTLLDYVNVRAVNDIGFTEVKQGTVVRHGDSPRVLTDGDSFVQVNTTAGKSHLVEVENNYKPTAGGDALELEAGAGNDVIVIKKGEDSGRYAGGAGNDRLLVRGEVSAEAAKVEHILSGGIGNDIYKIASIEAADSYIINQSDAGARDRDILSLTDFSSSAFNFAKNDNQLILTHDNGGTITINDWDNGSMNGVLFQEGRMSAASVTKKAQMSSEVVDVNIVGNMTYDSTYENNNFIFDAENSGYNGIVIKGADSKDKITLNGFSINPGQKLSLNMFEADNVIAFDLDITDSNYYNYLSIGHIALENYYDNFLRIGDQNYYFLKSNTSYAVSENPCSFYAVNGELQQNVNITGVNKDSFINLEAWGIDHGSDAVVDFIKINNSLVINMQVEDYEKSLQGSLTLTDYFLNQPVFEFWIDQEFPTYLKVGTDASDTENLDNYISNDVEGIVYVGLDGDDIVSASLGHNYIYTGNGNDHITLDCESSGAGFVFSGSGDDTIEISHVYDEGEIYAGDGNDIITVTDCYMMGDIAGETGNDIINVKGQGYFYLYGGTGDDSYIINWDYNSGYNIFNNAVSDYDTRNLAGINDKDTLTINGLGVNEVDFQLNDNTLTIGNINIYGWNEVPLQSITFNKGVFTETLDIEDIRHKIDDTYASKVAESSVVIKGNVAEVTFGTDGELVVISEEEAATIDTIIIKNSDRYQEQTVYQNYYRVGESDIKIDFKMDSGTMVGSLLIEDIDNSSIEKMYVGKDSEGEAVFNFLNGPQNKNYTFTDSLDRYVFLGEGWDTTISGQQEKLDQINLGSYRNRRILFDASAQENDLNIRTYYWVDNYNTADIGNITINDYFADANNNGKADGNEAGLRFYADNHTLNNNFYGTFYRPYVDNTNTDLNFNVKEYMASVGERVIRTSVTNDIGETYNLSPRGILFFSGNGDDIVVAGEGKDYIDTGAGNDTIYVNNRFLGTEEYLIGVTVDGTANQIFGGAGNDKIYIGSYDESNDTSAKCNNNYVRGGADDDFISIRGDWNDVSGGFGNDEIVVRGNNNKIRGLEDDDTLNIKWGRYNSISGGRGSDTYIYDWSKAKFNTLDSSDYLTEDYDTMEISGVDSEAVRFYYDEDNDKLYITSGEATGMNAMKGDGFGGEADNWLSVTNWSENPLRKITFTDDGEIYTTKQINRIAATISNAMNSLDMAATSFSDACLVDNGLELQSVDYSELLQNKVTGNI